MSTSKRGLDNISDKDESRKSEPAPKHAKSAAGRNKSFMSYQAVWESLEVLPKKMSDPCCVLDESDRNKIYIIGANVVSRCYYYDIANAKYIPIRRLPKVPCLHTVTILDNIVVAACGRTDQFATMDISQPSNRKIWNTTPITQIHPNFDIGSASRAVIDANNRSLVAYSFQSLIFFFWF